MLVKEISVFT